MPAVDTGGAKTGGPRKRLHPPAKPPTPPKPPSPAGDRPQTHGAPTTKPYTSANKAPAFRPITSQVGKPTGQAKPFRVVRSRTHYKENRAAAKLPSNSKLPRIPVITSPLPTPPKLSKKATAKQTIALLDKLRREASPAGDRPGTHKDLTLPKSYSQKARVGIYEKLKAARGDVSARELYMSSNMQERRYLRSLASALKTTFDQDVLSRRPVVDQPVDQSRSHPSPIARKLGQQGVAPNQSSFTPATAAAAGLTGPLTSAAAIADATYHDPVGVAEQTGKSLPLIAKALPSALVDSARNPGKLVETISKSSSTPYKEKVKRIKEHGAIEDLGNAALLLGPSGKALSLGAVERFGPTAALRISGGIVKARRGSPGVLRYGVRRGLDARKARSYERKAAAGVELTALEREALLANRAAGRTVEVVPGLANRQIAKAVAGARGRVVFALHYDLAKGDYSKVSKAVSGLSKDEKKAFWFSAAGGIRTAQQAIDLLPGLRAKMVAGRPTGLKIKGHYKKADVVARIDEVLADPARYFTPHLDETVNGIVEHVERISAKDPRYSAITKASRRRADQNVLLGLEQGVDLPAPKPRITAHEAAQAAAEGHAPAAPPALRYADESPEAFVARGDAHAEGLGLRKPLYFKSERQRAGLTDYAAATAGGGRAMAYEGQHLGRNLNKGLFDTSTQAFLRGYARNVKASHNWPLVEHLVDQHAFKGVTGEAGLHVGPALDAINTAEPVLDRGSVKLWNPGIFRREMETKGGDLPGAEHGVEDAGAVQIADAMKAATWTPDQLAKAVEHGGDSYLAKSSGWHAVPSAMLEELEAEMRVGTKGGRVWDIAKSKASRAIFAGNVPWFGFQVVSEGAMTAGLTRGGVLNPANWLGTRSWWKGLSHEDRTSVGQWVGLNSSGADSKQVRLGSMVDSSKKGLTPAGAVNGWRAMKAHPFWHTPIAKGHGPTLSQLNPVELMLAADRGKTSVLRLLAAHHIAKTEVVADMAKGMSAHEKAVTKVVHIFKMPPEEQMRAFAQNPQLLENMADTLNEWLGDWTTLTARERKGINRMVMFYPYVRYSTRLLFYTLPHDHPAVAATLAELGQLKVNEYREIFGDDDLPWNLGKVYWGKDGEMKSVDLARTNPVTNSIVDLAGGHPLSSAVGIAPPWFQWAIDQAVHKSTFRDAEWRVHGEAAPYGKKGKDYSLEDRARILGNQAFSLVYGYRLGMERTGEGTQGDDSLIWDKRPIVYKAKDPISKVKAANAKRNEDFKAANEGVGNALFGSLFPTPTRDVEASKERTYVKKLESKAAKKAADRKHYRDTHGGKNPPSPPKPKGFGSKGGNKPFSSGGSSGGFH